LGEGGIIIEVMMSRVKKHGQQPDHAIRSTRTKKPGEQRLPVARSGPAYSPIFLRAALLEQGVVCSKSHGEQGLYDKKSTTSSCVIASTPRFAD